MNFSYAKYRFREHRKGARHRNILFELTFEQWYQWWLNHGIDRNIPRRNNGSTLCMCRINDEGPYSLENIYCATRSQNNKDAHRNNNNRKGHTKPIHTPLGIFPSKIKAANYYNVNTTTISNWLKKNSSQFYYL